MNKDNAHSQLIWLTVICFLLVIYHVDSMWSGSVDLAHHYALSFRISEQWVLTKSNDPTLGEMNFYPRISHIIAAIVGVLVNSTFLGVQITTLTFLALLWMSILLTLSSLQVRLAINSIIILSMIVVFNAFSLKFDTHGHEIVGNFFYSQLIGHSALFIGMAIAIYLEKSKGPLSSIIFLTALMLANVGIHLLPALEMLGLIYALLIVYVFLGNNGSTFRFRLLVACGIAFAAILGIILHPSFAAMRAISENNGALGLHNISYPNGLILVCLIVIVLSFKTFIGWMRDTFRNDNIAVKYLAFYGGVTAVLCLFQLLLTKLDYGSDYAVKKYGFGLVTILFIDISIYFSLLALHFFDSKNIMTKNKIYNIRTYILLVSLCILFISSVPVFKSVDVSEIVAQERRLVALSYTEIPVPESGKSNVITGLRQLPNIINYMFSIAIAKTPRDLAISDLLIANKLDLDKYHVVISSYDGGIYRKSDCKSYSSGSISISDAACIKKSLIDLNVCKGIFDFSLNGIIDSSMISGFSHPEEEGRWTDGRQATFICMIKDVVPTKAKIYLTPFLSDRHNSQRLSISVNKLPAVNYKFDNSIDKNFVEIDLTLGDVGENYIFTIDTPDSISPKDVGFNNDSRKLGFMIKEIVFK